MPTIAQDLEVLVAAASRGDRKAQNELLQRYWPVIRQAVRGRRRRLGRALARREETVDLEQRAAIKVLAGLPKHAFRGGSAFVAWVKTLAENEVLDAARRNFAKRRAVGAETRLSMVEPPARTRSPESKVDFVARQEALLAALQELKPEYGAALLMHHLGFSLAEVGDALGCTAEAARKLVTRGRQRLLERMNPGKEPQETLAKASTKAAPSAKRRRGLASSARATSRSSRRGTSES